MRAGWVLALALCGCQAPYVEIDRTVTDSGVDATLEAATDTGSYVYPDARLTYPDGYVCQGHDEDGDWVPDPCDDCPSQWDQKQKPSASAGIGAACAPEGSDTDWKRSFFDPFVSATLWFTSADPLAFNVYPAFPDRLVGGSPTNDFWLALAKPVTPGKATVVTTWLHLAAMARGRSQAGVLARATEANEFVACSIMNSPASDADPGSGQLMVAIALSPKGGCPASGACTLELVKSGALDPIEQERYRSDPGGGLRMTVLDDGTVSCNAMAGVPGTGPTITTVVPAERFPSSGRVGVFASVATARFGSYEVLWR